MTNKEEIVHYKDIFKNNKVSYINEDKIIFMQPKSVTYMIEVWNTSGGICFMGDYPVAVFKYFSGTLKDKLRWVADFSENSGYGAEKYSIGMAGIVSPLARYDLDSAKVEAIRILIEERDERIGYNNRYNTAISKIKTLQSDSEWDKGSVLIELYSIFQGVSRHGDWLEFGEIIPQSVYRCSVIAQMILEQVD